MAQLVLTAAQSAGQAAARAGIGQAIARAATSAAVNFAAGAAERLLFGPRRRRVSGPRLDALQVQASTEGAGILRVYGRARVAGQLIWAANFKETLAETTERSGKGGRLSQKTTTTEYLYSLSFAVGLCEGAIDRIGRVWADGKPFDLSPHNVRVYRGTEDQLPDALIEAVEGADGAPAFRGLAYVVFEDLPLKAFGNRIPQLSFEVEKALAPQDPDALENAVTAVTMIPGSGEFVYGTTKVFREEREGVVVPENVHNNEGAADFSASLDALTASLPNLSAVSLAVSWFGTSLDAGACQIRPGVEVAQKTTTPHDWRAGGVGRDGAHLVSTVDGAPAYGGTPSDRSVLEAIAAMKARGLSVMFHPFVLMDAPGYPWRGRISVGANDKTAAAAADVAAFFGTAAPDDFAIENGEIVYSGPPEWSFRRFVLHCAHLCALAGGAESFLLGSELRGITTARADAASYPAVAALRALAADARSILGPSVKLSYGADWSEWFGHQPADGSGDVFFHLDPLWSDENIDFIGVDVYAPRADWRDGLSHLDAQAGWTGPYERAYLQANIEGGEGHDWFYASSADRDAQIRAPIADGAYGEPWVFRNKDFRNWWSNAHYDRPGGVRAATPTAWAPQSKPIRFTEIGCAAIDKGANQPNVFLDPKSSESAMPHYSSGARDDLAQRRLIEAEYAYWRAPANNPISSVYGGPMIETDRLYVYAWDARPFPYFPARRDVWGDHANWTRGHWLNGRAGRAPLDLLAAALAEEAGAENVDARGLKGAVAGYVLDRPLSAREAIDPLADIFQFDMVETAAGLRFQPRDGAPALFLSETDLVAGDEGAPPARISLAQASDLPAAFRLAFIDEGADYAPAMVEARDPGADHVRAAAIEAPLVMGAAEAAARARAVLADAHVMRETATFALPPSLLAVEPGDALAVTLGGVERLYRVVQTEGAGARRVEAARVSPAVYEAPVGETDFLAPPVPAAAGAPVWALLDLPPLGAGEARAAPGAPLFAAFADPWPGAVALYRDIPSVDGAAPALAATAAAPAVMGRLEAPMPAGFSGRWDRRSIRIRLSSGALASANEEAVLEGANALAVETDAGWEALQFLEASLDPDGAWTLSGLLRGQGGSEDAAAAGAPAGARVVLLGPALAEARFPLDLRDTPLGWRAGPAQDMPDTERFTAKTLALAARGLMPLSPVRLRAAPAAGGLALSWIRRARVGGDDWTGEVPLGEAYERYRLRILDGETVLRTVETDGPYYLYTDDEIAADFGPGGPGPGAAFEVVQLSDRVGAGVPARAGFGG
ncbi:baseplate multidomain protein megatron [Amphiplicatus metriothermophilus]|uniref:Putative phage tail protein n=1 Tax=Amphiplicatus metriothermophilus TaxID=1519374 RepID=A0A239PIG2_9PROT|nr:glycoside hydrolase/phage tail family protein [Amphiplicatus metriothermophilus]MBB5518098.1 hypothetical protein [Amphiplicatus metriothermophilus]SNT67568.1 Putative phage tail protein [Amphiplicatus metriothermophilus]